MRSARIVSDGLLFRVLAQECATVPGELVTERHQSRHSFTAVTLSPRRPSAPVSARSYSAKLLDQPSHQQRGWVVAVGALAGRGNDPTPSSRSAAQSSPPRSRRARGGHAWRPEAHATPQCGDGIEQPDDPRWRATRRCRRRQTCASSSPRRSAAAAMLVCCASSPRPLSACCSVRRECSQWRERRTSA